MELATFENTLFALEPIKRMVPTTITRMTANMTAYSAISCPSSPPHSWRASSVAFLSSSLLDRVQWFFLASELKMSTLGAGAPWRHILSLERFQSLDRVIIPCNMAERS